MALETGSFIDDLVITNPVGASDPKSQGDDHLRLIKTVVKATFPNADRAFNLKGALGTSDEAELTISSGAVTPTRSVHSIDTESDAATDDLDEMAVTNITDGGFVLLRANNDARTVVVKHNAGGATNPFLLQTDADFTIDQDDKWILVIRRGTQWIEVFRSFGSDVAAHRAFIDAASVSGAETISGNKTFSGDSTFTGEVNLDGPLALGDGSELTIATGVITPTANFHTVDTESDAASDDLTDLDDANMQQGAIVRLRAVNAARTVVVKHGTGNHKISLRDSADVSLDDVNQYIDLQLEASGQWYEVGRSKSTSFTLHRALFTSSNASWPVPTGVKRVNFKVQAGGGGGDNDQPGGGGGYVEGWISTDGTATLNITVGAGGAGAASQAGNGGASSVSDGTFTFQANGGTGGDAGAGSGGSGSTSGSPTSSDGEQIVSSGETGSATASGIGGKAGGPWRNFGRAGDSGNNAGLAGVVVLDYVQEL